MDIAAFDNAAHPPTTDKFLSTLHNFMIEETYSNPPK